jgi:hypothetical protein
MKRLVRNLKWAILPSIVLFLFSCEPENNGYDIPTTYTFDRDGSTTVNYDGQSQRLLMLKEMGDYIKNQATASLPVSATTLSDMYSNANTPFTDPTLNAATTKQLKNKTASSTEYFVNFNGGGSVLEQTNIRAFFESVFDSAATASGGTTSAQGVAGTYIDGASTRLFSGNGLEPQQVLLKGLMGACLLDQVSNNYLSPSVLDASTNKDDNTNKVLVAGQNYTAMEHYWDEAYGYIYGATGSLYWSSYIGQVNADPDFNTVSADINLAFRKGRAAIVNNDYTTRDAQIGIIRQKLALVCAVRAVYYLKDGEEKIGLGDARLGFHALSEGYGFIMALRYTNDNTNNPYFTSAEVATMLTTLTQGTNGFWDVNYMDTVLDPMAQDIAAEFGFTVAQAYE